MKILITTDWYDPVVNGVVTSVHTLMTELEKRGHEVRVLTEWGPELIHTQCEFSTFFPARRIARELHIPIIHTYHTIYEDYTHYFSPRKTWGRKVVREITRRLSRQVSGMIVPSEKLRRILEGYQVECPLWVIPSGIDLSRFTGGADAVSEKSGGESGPDSGQSWRERVRRSYGLPPEKTVLLYVGRLAKEKNIEELLLFQRRAAEMGTVLMIVGGGPHRAALEKQVSRMCMDGSVIFTGMIPREEVWKYYQAGDLFVSASTSETQGMIYGEALAAGLPVLCRRDGCLDGVIEEGENGWQYDGLEQFLAFLEKWGDLDDDGRRKMREYAERSAVRFSAEAFGREVERVYEQERKRSKGLAYHFAGGAASVCGTRGMGV